MTHELRCDQKPFDAISRGDKRCEIRKNDCGFKVGDFLYLRRQRDYDRCYTGQWCRVIVTHVEEDYGLVEGFAALSIELVETAIRTVV